MRLFTAKNLKQIFIQGELEPFCDVVGIDLDEFEQTEGHEVYYLMDREIEELKEKGIFPVFI
ncbi:hypothetical protein KDN24_07030 [Bacillus sp. Bva_UNVM-123]|uniref:hypothetical protein n=1 Tax=Bacillus sp. Bva_UNVM-123 TaxID=2829798 RepID=UPI00391F01EB